MIRSLLSAVLGIAALALVAGCGAPPAKYVGFDTGRDQPLKDDEVEVKKAAVELKEDEKLHVMVIGRADKRGDAAMNKDLSLMRARRVQTMLIAEGIDAGRIEVAARGEGDPTTDDESEDGLAENRRTEIFFFDPKDGDAQSHLKYKIEVEAKADAEVKADADVKK
jgi:hypothetical protein